jgi:hypothetical protein
MRSPVKDRALRPSAQERVTHTVPLFDVKGPCPLCKERFWKCPHSMDYIRAVWANAGVGDVRQKVKNAGVKTVEEVWVGTMINHRFGRRTGAPGQRRHMKESVMASKLTWTNVPVDTAPAAVKKAYEAVKNAEEALRSAVEKEKTAGKGKNKIKLEEGERIVITHRRGLAYAVANGATERRTEEW